MAYHDTKILGTLICKHAFIMFVSFMSINTTSNLKGGSLSTAYKIAYIFSILRPVGCLTYLINC